MARNSDSPREDIKANLIDSDPPGGNDTSIEQSSKDKSFSVCKLLALATE